MTHGHTNDLEDLLKQIIDLKSYFTMTNRPWENELWCMGAQSALEAVEAWVRMRIEKNRGRW